MESTMERVSIAHSAMLKRGFVAGALLAAWATGGPPAEAADYAAMSGKDLYRRFCAACHGESGRGDGPVSASLAVETPDLTMMARRHGGKFPRDQIAKIIDGRFIIGAHGSRTMPVWGEELSRLEIGNPDAESSTQAIVERLTDYLRTVQRPAP
jgi:mono/diheme cytochrome c family protein